MLTTWNDISFENGLSYRNTVLAYNLSDSQLNLLCDSTHRLINGHIKIFVTDFYMDLYTVPHFIGFLKFGKLQECEKQDFFDWWKECSRPPVVIDGEIFDSTGSITYILTCDNQGEEMPYLVFNDDIFEDRDKLEQTILREFEKQGIEEAIPRGLEREF